MKNFAMVSLGEALTVLNYYIGMKRRAKACDNELYFGRLATIHNMIVVSDTEPMLRHFLFLLSP